MVGQLSEKTAATEPLPQNTEVERLVLGLILIDADLFHQARPVLTGEDFQLDRHKRIWKHATALYDAGAHVDYVTVCTALRAAGDGFGEELSYIISLNDGVPQMPNIASYVGILKECALYRRIIVTAQHAIRRAQMRQDAPQAILESLTSTGFDLTQPSAPDGPQSTAEILEQHGLEKLLAPRTMDGLPFPWAWMNQMTGGMGPEELWILGGYTSMGKTSAMLQHAVSAARRGTPVLIFSREVSKPRLFTKAAYQFCGLDSERGKHGQLTDGERKTLRVAAHQLAEIPLYLDTSASTTMQIHAAVRRLQSRKVAIRHVIVDYLGLLEKTGNPRTRAEEVGANARALKNIASDFGLPVLALSQFSRPEKGKIRKPELGDLKESGDIENHANGVWFVHASTPISFEPVAVEFVLAKQRDGVRNVSRQFIFVPKCQQFQEEWG